MSTNTTDGDWSFCRINIPVRHRSRVDVDVHSSCQLPTLVQEIASSLSLAVRNQGTVPINEANVEQARLLEMVDQAVLRRIEREFQFEHGSLSSDSLMASVSDSRRKAIRRSIDREWETKETCKVQIARDVKNAVVRTARRLRNKYRSLESFANSFFKSGKTYPPVPVESTPIHQLYSSAGIKSEILPYASGVYFVWIENEVVYVGQSICLRNRISYSHECVTSDCELSWLELDKDQLNFAEAFYIGLLRPKFNFGNSPEKAEKISRPAETHPISVDISKWKQPSPLLF